jgi:cbb3-type cytochrome oxidase subunit 3
MLSQYLQSVTGIESLGVLSLVVAFALFAGVVVWALRRDRHTMQRLSRLPLEDADHQQEPREV